MDEERRTYATIPGVSFMIPVRISLVRKIAWMIVLGLALAAQAQPPSGGSVQQEGDHYKHDSPPQSAGEVMYPDGLSSGSSGAHLSEGKKESAATGNVGFIFLLSVLGVGLVYAGYLIIREFSKYVAYVREKPLRILLLPIQIPVGLCKITFQSLSTFASMHNASLSSRSGNQPSSSRSGNQPSSSRSESVSIISATQHGRSITVYLSDRSRHTLPGILNGYTGNSVTVTQKDRPGAHVYELKNGSLGSPRSIM